MYYLLLYDLCDDYLERRDEFRVEHLELAKREVVAGRLRLAGAFDDPLDGAALVFRAESQSVVEDFARRDPYVRQELVTSWRVRKWNVVAGTDLSEVVLRPKSGPES